MLNAVRSAPFSIDIIIRLSRTSRLAVADQLLNALRKLVELKDMATERSAIESSRPSRDIFTFAHHLVKPQYRP